MERKQDKRIVRGGRRGGALLIVFLMGVTLSSILLVGAADTIRASKAERLRTNVAEAEAAAEYGAELAIAQLIREADPASNGGDGAPLVTGDFVVGPFGPGAGRNLYVDKNGQSATDQRRIAGVHGDYQFRVRVRSARLAHDVNGGGVDRTISASWLSAPLPFDYEAGPGKFTDIYEITSSARHHRGTVFATRDGANAPAATVTTVVRMERRGGSTEFDELAALHCENPGDVQMTNMFVSGEDHYLTNFFSGSSLADLTIPTDPGQGPASNANFTSAEGAFWKGGNEILNYMTGEFPVPYYPMTRDFGATGNNIAMAHMEEAAAANQELKDLLTGKGHDTYFLGGKYSKVNGQNAGFSVTLTDGDPRAIKEASVAEASAGGKFDVVLGNWDDVLNVYAFYRGTYAGAKPALTPVTLENGTSVKLPTDGTTSSHIFVGGFSEKETEIISFPHFDPFNNKFTQPTKKKRSFSKHFVLRQKPGGNPGERQILAMNIKPRLELIIDDANYSKDMAYYWSNDDKQWFDWDGSYFWSDFVYVGDGRYLCFENGKKTPSPYSLNSLGSATFNPDGSVKNMSGIKDMLYNRIVLARSFEIEELMGMKIGLDPNHVLGKRYGRSSVVDGSGNFIPKDADGGYPGAVPIGLQGPLFDNDGKVIDLRGDPAGLCIIDDLGDPDNSKRYCRTMDEFMEVHEFTYPDGQTEEKRAVTLLVGLEDNASAPDFDYNDMVFQLTIAPPIPKKVEVIGGDKYHNGEPWWEQNENEGLTGKKAHVAISTNCVTGTYDVPKAFAQLWNDLTRDDWNALDKAHRQSLIDKAGIALTGDTLSDAEFEAFKDVIIAALCADVISSMNHATRDYSPFEHRGLFRLIKGADELGDIVAGVALANTPLPASGDVVYYSTNDVIYYRTWLENLYSRFKFKSEAGTLTPDQEAKYQRWRQLSDMQKNELAENGDADAETIRVTEGDAPTDCMSLVKHLAQNGYVPKYIDERFEAIVNERTMLNNGVDGSGDAVVTPFEVRKRRITARELAAEVFNPGGLLFVRTAPALLTEYDPASQTFKPVVDHGQNITSSEELTLLAGESEPDQSFPDEFVAAGALPLRTFTDLFQADGSQLVMRDFLEDAVDDSAAEIAAAAARAVEKCYRRYDGYDAAAWNRLEQTWGLKDSRLSIGFHRGGQEDALRDDMLQDHEEIVALGIRGFNPYHTVRNGNTGAEMIEKRRTRVINPNDPDDDDCYEYELALRSGADMPTFVFDRPLDGCGIMLINGNLLIRDTFAFHGTLFVLGDITVESRYAPDRLLYGPDGNPYDKDGISLSMEIDGGGNEVFYYIDSTGLRRNSTPLRAGNVAQESDFAGHLVFQGNLITRGKMRTRTGTPPSNVAVTMPVGRMDILYSDNAKRTIEEAIPPGRFKVGRLSWAQDDDAPFDAIWEDTLDD